MAGRDPQYLAVMRSRNAAKAEIDADAPTVADGADDHAVVRFWREADRSAMAEVPRAPMAAVDSVSVPGAARDLNARLYRPTPDSRTVLVFLHGGGWCFGDLESYDPVARTLAAATGLSVLSVAYRLAPEHPFPEGLEDAVAALRWAVELPAELAADRVAVGGDSAGGNLATVAARRLRDAGERRLAGQILLYPGVDLRAVPPYPPDPDGLTYDGAAAEENCRRYLAGADPTDPDISPLLAPDLRGMPPTVLATAEFDRFRAQGEAYAAALRAADVPVTEVAGEGLDHAFVNVAPLAPAAQAAVDRIGAAVRAVLLTPAVR